MADAIRDPPRKPALVAYLLAGDPSLSATRENARALREHVDVLELGIPFSDPVADGPVIQRAATRALAAGVKPQDVLDLVRDLRGDGFDRPILLMTYYNVLFRAGLENFVRRAADAGADGFVVPDLPLEESAPLRSVAREKGASVVLLGSPASDDARLSKIAKATSGFLYLVSAYGVTGARGEMPARTLDLVKRAKAAVGSTPLGVGFGVSSAEHVRALSGAGADAVIVGSAIVERIERGESSAQVAQFVRSLRA